MIDYPKKAAVSAVGQHRGAGSTGALTGHTPFVTDPAALVATIEKAAG